WRLVRRIALQQDLAADAVQVGVGPMLSRLLRERQRLINSCQGLFYVLPFGFDLGEQSLKEWNPILASSRGKCRDRLSKLRNVDFIVSTIATTCARPTEIHHSECQIFPESILSAQLDDPRCIA